MAIDTRDKLIAALAAGQVFDFYRLSLTAEAVPSFHSLWMGTGNPAAGATAAAYNEGSGYIPDNTTLGGLQQTNAVSGDNKLLQMSMSGSTAGKLILYDRVWTCSGLTTNGSNPTTLNITTPGNITRPADWLGLQIWGEVYGAPGATGSVWTVAYVDSADGAQTAAYTHPANAESVGQMFRFVQLRPDLGVKSITSLTTTVASGTAGSIGITVLKKLAEFPNTLINTGDTLDAFFLGMPTIPASACLAFMCVDSAPNTGIWSGSLVIGSG